MLDRQHLTRIVVLFIYFTVLGYYFYNYAPGYVIWPILVGSAIVWFGAEYYQNIKNTALVKNAFLLGFFLMVFDFIVENIGATLNLWRVSVTTFPVIAVPIEVMLLCLIGGTAWALAQPKKFNQYNAILDILLFSIFGMIGEFTLIQNGGHHRLHS